MQRRKTHAHRHFCGDIGRGGAGGGGGGGGDGFGVRGCRSCIPDNYTYIQCAFHLLNISNIYLLRFVWMNINGNIFAVNRRRFFMIGFLCFSFLVY